MVTGFSFQGDDRVHPGNEPRSPILQADSFPSEPPVKPRERHKDKHIDQWNQFRSAENNHYICN